MCAYVCVRVRMCMHVYVCVHARARVCVRMRVCILGDNIRARCLRRDQEAGRGHGGAGLEDGLQFQKGLGRVENNSILDSTRLLYKNIFLKIFRNLTTSNCKITSLLIVAPPFGGKLNDSPA